MLHINEVIVVEGLYDKIRLESITDATIISVDGFGIYRNRQLLALLKDLAQKRGLILLTDSDAAGFRIRSYIKSYLGSVPVKHAYIPQIKGKERRKEKAGKEGTLGVEGLSTELLTQALERCGITPRQDCRPMRLITKADMYEFGLLGGEGSAEKRRALARKLSLPTRLSASLLLQVLNTLYTYEEFTQALTR